MKRLRALILTAVLCLLAWLSPDGAAAQRESLSLEDYWKLAGTTRLEVNTLANLPDVEIERRLDTIAKRWEAIESVRLEDGSEAPVDHSELAGLLRSPDPDLESISERLNTLSHAGALWQAQQMEAAYLARLDEILSQAEYQWQEEQPSVLERLWQRVIEWIGELLERLFGDRELSAGGLGLDWLLPGLGLGVVLLALGYIFREVRRSMAGDAALETEAGPEAEFTSSNSAFQRALDVSQGGDRRSAVRYLFLSALLLLDERGRIHYDRTQTNRETLRSLKDQPELSTQMADMVEVFDRVWYGYQPLEPPAFEQFVRRVQSLREER